ncbi:MAG: DUF1460 domain-containing protein [Prevotella sp.]|uniref:N-acetylmuramoyl-L-alanine amidase-like domain-containing protein n=1 Tax=Prevotella sp. TaxID=59823 RepID=UPI002A28DC52|nr:N-acetylmuramoyl-L-alanine amidase-like domain-containing protein [Prevotella sp.]MDD7318138.1 DUF1460 domain-containing protein [Prevotellaceae bacterium]MDY4020973.1 DUF1460 domain-containing protein [Prevotella sp.]
MIRIFVIGLMFFLASSATASGKYTYSKADSVMVVRLLSEAKTMAEGENMVLFFARKFIGKPYVAHTLEVNSEEQLVINLRQLDCTTFVETVLALAMTAGENKYSFKDYCDNLTKIRYNNGVIEDYSSRLHYFTAWITDNVEMGIVDEVKGSKALFSGLQTVDATYMTKHSDSYKMLAGNTAMIGKIALMEKELCGQKYRYIPNNNIRNTQELRNVIHDGDVIAIVTNKKGLEISHLGFAVWKRDGLHLLNASSLRHRVVEESSTLRNYLIGRKTALGVRVLRFKLCGNRS